MVEEKKTTIKVNKGTGTTTTKDKIIIPSIPQIIMVETLMVVLTRAINKTRHGKTNLGVQT